MKLLTVRAHESTHIRVPRAALEWLQVVFNKILLGYLGIKLVPEVAVPALNIISGVMFASSYNPFVLVCRIALKAKNQGAYV